MQYISYYASPLGKLLLTADEEGLNGLWFGGQQCFSLYPDREYEEKETEIIADTKHWLDIYFSGKEPDFKEPLHFIGTDFRKMVWKVLCEIPYGETTTYGEIAQRIAKKKGVERMSAQAIGGAVGHNEIAIIVPCHRVIGKDGSLTGYAAGLQKKIYLLKLEGHTFNE